MSGLSGDLDPKRPRKTRSTTRRKLSDDPGPEESSTFRPNPKSQSRRSSSSGSGAGRGTLAGVPLERVPEGRASLWERIFYGRVTSGQLAAFCRQFAAYLHAGVDIGKALQSLKDQFKMTRLGPVIDRLNQGIRRGEPLADCCAREPQAFDTLFLSMIRVAEARGGVPEILRKMGEHYEARQSLIRQARSAMIYPAIVLVMTLGVVTLLTTWLLPMFAELLKEAAGQGAQLPLPSRFLLWLADFVKSAGWFLIPAVLIGSPLLLIRAYKTSSGKRAIDRFVMITPVFGKLFCTIDNARLARSLATLLDAGVDMNTSLDLTSDVLRLSPLQAALRDTRAMVIHGSELSEALGSTGQFPPQVIAVVNSGEETGKLPETLNHLADDFEEQVEYTVRNLGQLLQPLMVIVMGGVVLFVILAVLLPYISIITSFSR